jgi:dihydrolipoamide dehydrogenase
MGWSVGDHRAAGFAAARLGENAPVTRIAIVGGGPAGYEAALVAVQLGAEVALVERDGVGGQCVLSNCVPSKTW